jgi:hypothetical protein
VGYGFSPRTLLVWLTPIRSPEDEVEGVLCRRHADLTTVPRGWTLDDRRESALRLFRPPVPAPRPPTVEVEVEVDVDVDVPTVHVAPDDTGEQLRLDDSLLTGADVDDTDPPDVPDGPDDTDTDDTDGPDALDATGALDLTGAMERPDPEIVAAASSELLARAFLGTTRRQPRRRMRP